MHDLDTVIVQFGQNVRERRRAKGMTQEDLSARTRLHRTYVAGVERGGRNISLTNVAKLARGLGLSVSQLCERLR